MSTTTTILGMTKPDSVDQALISQINANMDILDNTFTSSAATTCALADAAAAGTALAVARQDHRHGFPSAANPVATGNAISGGAAATLSRSDHVHTVGSAQVLPAPAITSYADIQKQGAAPAAPVAGYLRIYADNSDDLYLKTSGGVATKFIESGDSIASFAFTSHIDLAHQASPPASPSAGYLRVYESSDDLYVKNSGGTESKVARSGGSVTSLTVTDLTVSNDLTVTADVAAGSLATTGNLTVDGFIDLDDETATPAAPSAGYTRLYTEDNRLYLLGNGGIAYPAGMTPELPLIINGGMQIAQRGTSFAAVADDTYTLDRWRYSKSVGTGVVHTISQSSDAPAVADTYPYNTFSILLDCTTTEAAVAAGDNCYINQYIEGWRFRAIAQREFTISWWVKATKTGTYCVAFQNSGADRSYVAEYSVSSSATWERKTVTVSASPSAGTWDYTTGIGLNVIFTIFGGTTFQTTADAWQTGNYNATANQVNGADNTLNDFRIAMVQIDPGPVARPYRNIPFAEDHLLCQRYYWKTFEYATAPAQNAGRPGEIAYGVQQTGTFKYFAVNVRFPVPMRTAPTITTYNPQAANAKWRNITDAADSETPGTYDVSTVGFTIQNPQVAGDTIADACVVQAAADAEI